MRKRQGEVERDNDREIGRGTEIEREFKSWKHIKKLETRES